MTICCVDATVEKMLMKYTLEERTWLSDCDHLEIISVNSECVAGFIHRRMASGDRNLKIW